MGPEVKPLESGWILEVVHFKKQQTKQSNNNTSGYIESDFDFDKTKVETL